MTINNIQFDPQKLMTKDQLLDFLAEDGGSDRTLAEIRETQYEQFGNELIWRYPISDGNHCGTFIAAVQDGFISLPYDVIDRECGEILELQDASMFDKESMQIFIDDWNSLSSDLVGAMSDMLGIMDGE